MKAMRVVSAAVFVVMLVISTPGTQAGPVDDVRDAMKRKDFRRALELAEPLARQQPDSAEVLGLYARALHQNGRIEGALEVWKELQAKTPDDKTIARAAAKASDLLERSRARVRFLESMIEKERSVTGECRALLRSFHPISLRGTLHLILARSLLLDGKPDEAINEAAKLREEHAGQEAADRAWILMARIYDLQPEKRERALKTIDALLSRQPSPARPLLGEARMEKANILMHLARFPEAIGIYEEVLKQDPPAGMSSRLLFEAANGHVEYAVYEHTHAGRNPGEIDPKIVKAAGLLRTLVDHDSLSEQAFQIPVIVDKAYQLYCEPGAYEQARNVLQLFNFPKLPSKTADELALRLARSHLDEAAARLEALKKAGRRIPPRQLAEEEAGVGKLLALAERAKAGDLRGKARAEILRWGHACAKDRRFAAAVYVLTRFLEKSGKSPLAAKALLARAEIYLAMPAKPHPRENEMWPDLHQNAALDLTSVLADFPTSDQAVPASRTLLDLYARQRDAGRLELAANLYREFIRLNPKYRKLDQVRCNLAGVHLQLGVKEAKRLEAQGKTEETKKLLAHFEAAAAIFAEAVSGEKPEPDLQEAALQGIDAIATHYQALRETTISLEILDRVLLQAKTDSLKKALLLRKWRILFDRGTLELALQRTAAGKAESLGEWHRQGIDVLATLYRRAPKQNKQDVLDRLGKLAEVYTAEKQYGMAADVYGLALADKAGLAEIEAGLRFQRIHWLKASAELARSRAPNQHLKEDELKLSKEFQLMLGEVDALVAAFPESAWSLNALDLVAQTAQYHMDRKAWKTAREILDGFIRRHQEFPGAARAAYLRAMSFKHQAAAKSFQDPNPDSRAPLNPLYRRALAEYQEFLTKHQNEEELIDQALKDVFAIAATHEQRGFWRASGEVYRIVLEKNPDTLYALWLRYQAGLSNAAAILPGPEILEEKKATPASLMGSGYEALNESKLRLKGKRNARQPLALNPEDLSAIWAEGLDSAKLMHGPYGEEITYEAQSGDTLGTICQKILGRADLWPEVAKHNGLPNADKLEVGQVVKLRRPVEISAPLSSDVELLEVTRKQMMTAVDAFIGIMAKDTAGVRLKPKAEASLLRIVLSLRDRNLWTEAAALYGYILKKLPDHKQARVFELQRAYSLANAAGVFGLTEDNIAEFDSLYDRARQAFGSFRDKHPDSDRADQARQAFTSSYLHQGRALRPVDRPHAVNRLLSGLEYLRSPDRDLEVTPGLWLELARELESCKAYADAVDAYLDHARTFPVSKDAPGSYLSAAGILRDHLRNKMRAILAFQEYHHSTGTSEDVVSQKVFDLCLAFQVEKNWVAAVSAYNLFISNFPRHLRADDALRNIGEIHKTTELWQDALEIYDRFMDDYPGSELMPSVKLSRAVCFENLSQWDKAIKIYEDFVDAGRPVQIQRVEAQRPSQANGKAPGTNAGNPQNGGPTANETVVNNQPAANQQKLEQEPQQARTSAQQGQGSPQAQGAESPDQAGQATVKLAVTPDQLKEKILTLKDVSRFQELIDNYKDNDKLDEAQFEIAEIVLKKLGNTVKAIQEFRKVAVEHAKSYKADDAQFMVGRLLLDLERFDEARDELLLVVKRYPESPFSDDALFHHAWSFEREAEMEEGLTSEERIRRVIEKGQKARFLKRAKKK